VIIADHGRILPSALVPAHTPFRRSAAPRPAPAPADTTRCRPDGETGIADNWSREIDRHDHAPGSREAQTISASSTILTPRAPRRNLENFAVETDASTIADDIQEENTYGGYGISITPYKAR